MKNKILPNFLIAGAAKSGTTAIYNYIKGHPQIFVPDIKEPCFFSSYKIPDNVLSKNIKPMTKDKLIVDYYEYLSLFSNVDLTRKKAIGEVSTHYLFQYKETIKNIKNIYGYNGVKIKIIIILRNPIIAAFSNYQMWLMKGVETKSFREVLEENTERYNKKYYNISYISKFLYHDQIKHYLDYFSDVKIILYDDFVSQPQVVLKEIFNFLDVSDSFIPSNMDVKYNVSGFIIFDLLHKFLTSENIIKTILIPIVRLFGTQKHRDKFKFWLIHFNIRKATIDGECKEILSEKFQNDIISTGKLIGRDLSVWLQQSK